MRPHQTLAEMIKDTFHGKYYEPKERKFAGSGVQFVGHRFPIKDGISLREVMVRRSFKRSPLLELFIKNKEQATGVSDG